MDKILLIEDEKDIIDTLSKALKMDDNKYEIYSALGGQPGLELAREIRPDVIVLDIMMPDLSGLDVCRTLKSDVEFRSIPIIMLTALDKSEDAVQGLSVGADDYVSKPFDTSELLARIKSQLRNKHLYDQVKDDEEDKSIVLDISQSISSTSEPQETLFSIVSSIPKIIEVKRCSIVYIDPVDKKGVVMTSHDSKEIKHLEIDLDKYPEIQEIMRTGKAMVINDVQSEPVLSSVKDKLNLVDIRSIMAFPITFRDDLIGTLILRTSRREAPFSEREIKLCSLISNLAASPLKNAYFFETLFKEKEKERGARMVEELKRKRAQEELVRKEKTLSEAQRIAKLGSWEWDVVRNKIFWSDEVYRLFGLKPREVEATYDVFISFVHPDDRESVKNSVNDALHHNEHYNIDHRIVLPDGKIRIMHENAEVVFDDNSKPIRMVGTIQDITGRKRAEEDLRLSEERYRNLLQTIPDIIYKIDLNGNFTFVNTSVMVLGYEPDELIGKHFSTIVHPDDVKSVSLSKIMSKYAGKKTGDKKAPKVFDERRSGERMTKGLEIRLVKKKQNRFDEVQEVIGHLMMLADVSASGLYRGEQGNDEKKLLGTVGIIRDVTESKRIKKLLESQRQQLIQADKMASLGTMAAGVAHEINNPNSFIMLNTPLLQKMWKDIVPLLKDCHRDDSGLSLGGLPFSDAYDNIPKLLTGITEGSRRIKSIVEGMKEFVRMDSSKSGTRFDINDAVNKAISLTKNQLKKHTEHFSVDLCEKIPVVKGNILEIEQVIINLITNACHALTGTEQKIVIRTYPDLDSTYVAIDVTDEGKGIPPENIKKITDPFFTTKREEGGTGLGLSISYNISRDHGGTLNFVSEPGKGTTATVLLPVAEKTEDSG